ncbi:HAMP domain-containing histidine kinase [Staphylococcus pseudintermedius]|nr:HAMP domain-containing histidine kinase [Staphylococcus pseudintermedius]
MTIRKQLIYSFIVTIITTTFLFYTLYKLMWFDGPLTILLTLCSFLSGMMTLIIGIFFTVPMIKKIERLNHKTQKIANGQFETEKTKIHAPKEIQQLSESFDQMVDKIQEQMNLIKEEQEEKMNLVQNLAHDLKTPLASIKSYSEGLRDGIIHSECDTKKAYSILISQSDRLSRMFDDLTDVITVNHQESEQTLIHMDRLLIPIFEIYSQKLHHENRQLDVEIDPNIKPFIQDQRAIERILMNFIDNALKFSDHGSPLAVKVFEENDEIAISVIDQGMGIMESDIKNIFERTFRVESSRHKDTGGSGLGLYIAKTLAHQMDGHIEVSSTYGQGTAITLYFPPKVC